MAVLEMEPSQGLRSKARMNATIPALQTLPYKGDVVFILLLVNKDWHLLELPGTGFREHDREACSGVAGNGFIF